LDETLKVNPRKAKAEGVLWGDSVQFIATFLKYLGTSTNNHTMLEEIKAGLKLCLDLNLQQVIFERDSKVIIDFLSKRNKDPRWHMEGLDFEAVKNPKGEMFQVQHVGKKCKKVADVRIFRHLGVS
jgi:ribonuclease HI